MNIEEINLIYNLSLASLKNKSDSNVTETVRNLVGITQNLGKEDENRAVEIVLNKLDTYFNTNQNESEVLDHQEVVPWLHTVKSDEYYSQRYYNYLQKSAGLPLNVINEMKATNRNILERLGNPNVDTPFRRQGLVVGNVQSGKTANYLSLISLASDYGYKLIILITGIHNNLRSQTQKRVNNGFIGFDSEKQDRRVGVGIGNDEASFKIIDSKMPHCLTTVTQDFNIKTRTLAGLRLENAKNPVIMVIKKNYRTLENVIEWLGNNNNGKHFIKHSVLIIDDEADNASINTSKNPNEATRINGQIREMLNLFRYGSYIGYTATPFANIFIDHNVRNEDLEEDLFPKDFIFTLEAPDNYVGATKFFLDEYGQPNYDSSFIEFINDNQTTIPLKKPKDFSIQELPKSMVIAIYDYLVSIVIKRNRPILNKHTSMLINISHKKDEQKEVSYLVSQVLEEIKLTIKYEGSKPQKERIKNTHLCGIYNQYLNFSKESDVDQFFECLQDIIDSVKVRVINSDSQDSLDYDNYKDGLNVIAIGGYSLSRGFTLEGLTISYLIRNTAMADTLLQMGRWFGYKDSYEDLCKLYIPEPSFEWYSFIAQSIEELRKEFKIMAQNNLTPYEYGLKVRSSNTGLLITARNKMYHADEIRLSESFSEETFTLRGIVLSNLDKQQLLFKQFCNNVNDICDVKPAVLQDGSNKSSDDFNMVYDVDVDMVLSLLKSYEYSVDDIGDGVDLGRNEALIEYIEDRVFEIPKWDVLIHKKYFDQNSKSQKRTFNRYCYYEDHVKTADGGGRILRPWEEAYGLTKEQYKIAEQQREISKVKQTAHFFRKNRTKPLLALKSLDLYKSEQSDDGTKTTALAYKNVPAFAISFPKSKNSEPVSYVANKVFLNDYFGETDDDIGNDDE